MKMDGANRRTVPVLWINFTLSYACESYRMFLRNMFYTIQYLANEFVHNA